MKQREIEINRIINTFNIPEMKLGRIVGKVDRSYNRRLINQCLMDICWLFDLKTGDMINRVANETI